MLTTPTQTMPTAVGGTTHRRRGAPLLAAAALIVVAAAIVGCSGTGRDSASTARESADASSNSARSVAGSGDRTSASAAKDAPALVPIRLRAVSGTLVVRTPADADLEDSVRSATATITGLGGYLYSEDSSFGRDGSATVTYKVPPDRFDEAVTELSKLGTAVSSSVDTTDVTDAVVDLDSRIRSAEASVARVRALLDDASSLGDVTMLEGELTRRETTLEQLTGQRRQTVGTAEMSTLALTLDRTAKPAVAKASAGWMESVPGFGSALASGWRAFANVMRVLAAALGYVAPFLGLVVLALVTRRWSRRRAPALAPTVGRDGEI